MSFRGVRFHDGYDADVGIGVAFSRVAATTAYAGTAVSANTPNYATEELICGAPIITTIDSTSSNSRMQPHHGGYWIDGTTNAIITDRRAGTDYRINIHVGTAIATDSFLANATRTANIQSDSGDALYAAFKAGSSDIVRLAGAGRGESVAHRYEPYCFMVRDGLAISAGEDYYRDTTYTKTITAIAESTGVALVTIASHGLTTGDKIDISGSNSTPSIDGTAKTVTVVDANTFTVTRASTITVAGTAGTAANRSTVVGIYMAYWDEAAHVASPGSNYWTIPSDFRYNTAVNPAHGVGLYKGSRWMIQPAGFAKSTDGLTMYVAFGNYEANTPGRYTMVQTAKFTRTTTTGAWAYDSGVLNFLVDRGTTSNGTHVHSVGIVIQADGSLVWIVSMGDTLNQHYLVGYADSWASISGAGTYAQTTDTKSTQNGQTWWNSANGDPWATARVGCSQTMGLAWTGSGLNWVATCDETAPVFVNISMAGGHVVTSASTTAQVKLDITTIKSRPTNDAQRGWNAFNVQCHPRGYGPPYYTHSRANTAWASTLGPARFDYSPDGLITGMMFAPNLGGSANLGFGRYGNYLIWGSNNTALFATPAEPATVRRRGLRLGPGSNNYIRSTALTVYTHSSYLGSGNTAAVGKPTISGRTLDDPPFGFPETYHVANITSSQNLGMAELADAVPKTTGIIKVSGWIKAELQELPDTVGTAPHACQAVQITMQGYERSSLPGTARSSSQISVVTTTGAGWEPFTVEFVVPSSWSNAAGIPDPFGMNVRVMNTPNTSAARACQVRIAWGSVTVGTVDQPHNPVPRNTTTTTESAYLHLTGWACGDAWSAFINGHIPREGPDEYSTNRPSTRVLFSLKQSPTKYITATIDTTNNWIRFTTVDGATSTNVDVAAPSGFEFEFSRTTPISVGLSKTGTSYRFSVSVGSSPTKEVTQTIGSTDIRPTSMLAGDQNGQNLDSWVLNDVRIDETTATTAAGLTTQLQTLTAAKTDPVTNLRGGRNARTGRF